jgi:superfamily II DNA or RNA helicase
VYYDKIKIKFFNQVISILSKYHTVIYWYTTPMNKALNQVKNGSARRDFDTPYEVGLDRIKEQQTAAFSHDPFEILHIEDVSDMCETGDEHESLSRLRTLEKSWLHAKQKDIGMWCRSEKDGSEWFFDPEHKSVDNVVNIGMSLVNEKRFGVTRPDSFIMREEQKECHDVAVTHYKNGGDRFLINAKMRFGKTFTAYQIAKSLDVKRVLVLTYKPQVESGWDNDLSSHVDFDGWTYNYAKNFDRYTPVVLDGQGTTEVLFASFQDLNDMKKTKWKNIVNYHFDLVVIDEQHYGADTEQAKCTLDAISFDKIIEVSGTPLHALMGGKFNDDEIYSWSYADEQRKRKEEKDGGWVTEIYRWLPTMQFMTFEISEEAKRHTSFYTDDEGFTMQKMFSSNDGKTFNDEAAVKLWLEGAYGVNGHKNNSPVRAYNSDHMVWKLPSVNSCRAMEGLMQKTPWIKHTPVVVSGAQGTNLTGVKRAIRNYEKTVTLTCGSLMTGTTVPEWDMIFMLDGGSSAQDYFQTIFRVQSANKKARKETCYVVDYNPQRTLEMIYEYNFTQATVNGKTAVQNVSEFLDFAPVLDHSGNKPVRKNVNDVLQAVAHTSKLVEKFGSWQNADFSKIDNDIRDILLPINQDTSAGREVTVNDNGIEKGKNKINLSNTPSNPNQPDIGNKEMQELQQKTITMMRMLPTYIWMEGSDPKSVQEIFDLDNQEDFFEVVGINLREFKKLCDMKFINTKRLDVCILSFQLASEENNIA